MTAPPSLWTIGYVSIAPRPLARDELDDILERSRVENAQAGVTGLLLHCDGTFIQVLEGPRPAVEHIFDRIRRSRLHTDITQLFSEPAFTREFGEWAMACKHVSPEHLQVLRHAPPGSNRKLLAEYWKAWH